MEVDGGRGWLTIEVGVEAKGGLLGALVKAEVPGAYCAGTLPKSAATGMGPPL